MVAFLTMTLFQSPHAQQTSAGNNSNRNLGQSGNLSFLIMTTHTTGLTNATGPKMYAPGDKYESNNHSKFVVDRYRFIVSGNEYHYKSGN